MTNSLADGADGADGAGGAEDELACVRALLYKHREEANFEQMCRDFRKYYFATIDGFVWTRRVEGQRTKIREARVLAYRVSNTGYHRVCLLLDGKRIHLSVHRVVAFTLNFQSVLALKNRTGLEFNEIQIDHIDQNRLNNSLENLRPCTPGENLLNRTDVKCSGPALSKPVRIVFPENDGRVFDSTIDAAKKLNLDHGSVSNSCRKGWKVRGFKFEYVEFPDLPDEIWFKSKIWVNAKIGEKPFEYSNKGRVKTSQGVKTFGSKSGYYRSIGFYGQFFYVHVLIYRAFHLDGAPIPYDRVVMHVNLKDADRRCNDGTERNWLEDLVLGTQSENAKEAFRQRKRAREEEQKEEQKEESREKVQKRYNT